MTTDIAFEMATASIRFGAGITREIGAGCRRSLRRSLHTDALAAAGFGAVIRLDGACHLKERHSMPPARSLEGSMLFNE